MSTQKILIGLTYWKPNISGVTQYAVILSETLAKRNYEVCVIASNHNKQKIKEKNITLVDGWQIGKGYLMPLYWLKSCGEVKKVDVVNCHLPAIESFWLALWAKIFGKKIIVTHHCEFGFDGPISNRLIALITFPFHFMSYLWADKIVAYTKDYAKSSMFLRIFRKKVVYVLPPIKVTRTKIQIPRNKQKIVGFVGRIAWEKGLDVLVEAMKKVDAKLMLVGPYKNVAGDSTYKKLKNVELVGPIEHDKLNKYFAKFDCLVLPSTNNLETFGIVQAEAMVCGTPVVATNLPGVRVPVTMTKMGEICNPSDAADLAVKINTVLKNGKKFYQKRAININKFDYQKTVDEYEKIFRKLL